MLEIQEVTKRYGTTLAVDRVSFDVAQGEIVGFLGPNGAGKSTVLRMISTYLAPDAGTVRVAGHDVGTEPLAARASLGYLTEHNALYESMRVLGWLDFVGRAHGLSGARLAERRAWTIEACSLQAVVNKRIGECSKGYRQRIGLAASLIHDPRVIVLDEPTHGLDPLQMAAFRDFLRSLAPGRAILFSSHIVGEVIEASERVVVIHQGRLVADERVSELARRAAAEGRSVESLLLGLLGAGRPGTEA